MFATHILHHQCIICDQVWHKVVKRKWEIELLNHSSTHQSKWLECELNFQWYSLWFRIYILEIVYLRKEKEHELLM